MLEVGTEISLGQGSKITKQDIEWKGSSRTIGHGQPEHLELPA